MMLATALPVPVLFLAIISGIFCLPIFALSMVNFGLLSIWLNAFVAVVIAVHHIVLGSVMWASRKRTHPSKAIIDDEESSPLRAIEDLEPPAVYSLTNIAFLVGLVILNALAFSTMVDITTRGGANSTLPAERVGHKWNLKIQIGQTTMLGAELLVLSAILTLCTLGRQRFTSEVERRKGELEY